MYIIQNDKGEFFTGWDLEAPGQAEPQFSNKRARLLPATLAQGVVIAVEDAGNSVRLLQLPEADEQPANISDLEALQRTVAVLEAMRPHWAKGYTSDGVEAQTMAGALSKLWEMLGATSQTQAVMALEALISKFPHQMPPTPDEIERAAKAVYEAFDGAHAHPWVEGGNSNKQEDARRAARAALSALKSK